MSRIDDGVFCCDCGAQCRPDQTEECRICGETICHSCGDTQDYLCVNCELKRDREGVEFEPCLICGCTEPDPDGYCPQCEIAMEIKSNT